MRKLSTLALSAALGCGLLLGAAPARALTIETFDVDPASNEASIPKIHVTFDLQADNWNAATADPVKFRFFYSIVLYKAFALADGSHVSIGLDNMYWSHDLHSTKSGNEAFDGTVDLVRPANQLSELKNLAVNLCRTIRGNGGKPNKDRVFRRNIKAEANLDVWTTAQVFTEKTKHVEAWAAYDVVCDANPKWHEPIKPAEDFTADKGDFKVQSIDLFLATFQGQETNPNPGTSCKKLKVTVRIETNKSGLIKYKLWRQPGEAVEKFHRAEMKTEGQFKGRFIIEDTFVDTFDKTTYIQYMAEVTNQTFGPSTRWKPITIQCGGGLTTGQPQGGGDLIPSFKVTSAELKIISVAGAGCPTKAFVTATFFANKPGKFKYFIGTSLNKNKSGELEAKKVGAVYRARETLTVDITKSGKLTAHARPVDFPAASVFASKSYNCAGLDPVDGVTN